MKDKAYYARKIWVVNEGWKDERIGETQEDSLLTKGSPLYAGLYDPCRYRYSYIYSYIQDASTVLLGRNCYGQVMTYHHSARAMHLFEIPKRQSADIAHSVTPLLLLSKTDGLFHSNS